MSSAKAAEAGVFEGAFPGEMTALFKVGKAEVDVQLGPTHILWDKPNRKDKAAYSNSLAIADILAVKDEASGFDVHYMARVKHHVCKVEIINFKSSDETTARTWAGSLRKRLESTAVDQQRPTNVLVFVNPDSGEKQAVKIYEKHAAPLFDLAGVQANVTVTESAGHLQETLQNCDLDGVDGIIAVGGDGTLTGVLNGAMKRYMKEAGRDVNNPDEELVDCPIRIGLIPAGSGHCISEETMGTADVTTSVLHIIMGNSVPRSVMSAYSDNQLLSYSTLIIGYGFYGEVVNYAESNRQCGGVRYLYAMFKGMTTYMKPYDFDIHYVPTKDFQEESKEKAEPVGTDGWFKAPGPFVSLFVSPTDVETLDNIDGYNWVHLQTKVARIGMLKTWCRMSNHQANAFDFDFMKNLKVKMLKIVNGPPREEDGTDVEAGTKDKHSPLTNKLMIDGESHQVSDSGTLIRFHGTNYKIFGTAPSLEEARKTRQMESSPEKQI